MESRPQHFGGGRGFLTPNFLRLYFASAESRRGLQVLHLTVLLLLRAVRVGHASRVLAEARGLKSCLTKLAKMTAEQVDKRIPVILCF